MTLQDWLKREKVTKYRAAKDLGVAWTSMWRWNTGRATPQPEMMRKIEAYTKGAVQPNDWISRVN